MGVESKYIVENVVNGDTLDATETAISSEIDVKNYDRVAVFIDYTKGDETSMELVPKFTHAVGGTEFQLGEWSVNTSATYTERELLLSATGQAYVLLDVRGVRGLILYDKATGGTPTGTIIVDIARLRD